jgi:hypothetical protein
MAAPALFWAAIALAAGQPGVLCLTPLAWSLALYSGSFYGRRVSIQMPAFPGGFLAGTLLGLLQGAFVVYGNTRMMAAETSAESIARGTHIPVIIALASIVLCALLSGTQAHVAQRRHRA